MRLAWFTPWPPDPSGIAGRSAEVVPRLAALGHAIDVFVDARRVPVVATGPEAAGSGAVRVLSAHDFVWRQARHPYDLAVYQIGNSRLHEFIWPYLLRWPGLAVLHDARVHHARARALLLRRRHDDYRAEFAWNHPDVTPDAAELAVAGFGGAHYYQWSLVRAIGATSKMVVCHAPGAVDAVRTACPEATVAGIALGEGRPDLPTEEFRLAARRALGLPEHAVLFGVFGALSAEKRVPEIIRAFAATRGRLTPAHLVLVGTETPAIPVSELVQASGLDHVVHRLTSLDDDGFDRAIAAVDVSLNLRWPSSLETSGPWLRALAAGRPTVIMDLAHYGSLPTLDPRTWQPHAPSARDARRPPVAVAIDILDEEHSLRRAFVRLGWDKDLRAELGLAGRRYWEAHHTIDRMVHDYARLLPLAAAAMPPAVPHPAHLRPDPLAFTEGLLTTTGVALPLDAHRR